MSSLDAVIIGGGPAGLAAAIALRKAGIDVMVADGAGPEPIDKACGEGLMPDAVAALQRLGVDIRSAERFPFRGIRFLGAGVSVEASFPDGCGIGVRRTTLHRALMEGARGSGVLFRWQSPVTGISNGRVQAGGDEISAGWIVGADGGFSAVRRWAGLHHGMKTKLRYGFRKHYQIEPWSEYVEVHWGERCQAYVTPVGLNEVGVAILSSDPALRLDVGLRQFQRLEERLRGATELSTERGGVSANRVLKRVASGRVALIGDASGGVDAVTGEGLSLAFQQASELADAIARGNLNWYSAAHARIRRRPLMMAEILLMLDRWSGLRARVLPALAERPQLFARMLAGHVGPANPAAIAVNLAQLGWGMIF